MKFAMVDLCLISNQMELGFSSFVANKQLVSMQQTKMFEAFPAQVTQLLYFHYSWSTRLPLNTKSQILALHVLSSKGK